MKRINPLLTTNNPAPIPGCHAPVKAVAHSALSMKIFINMTIYIYIYIYLGGHTKNICEKKVGGGPGGNFICTRRS